VKLLPIAVAGGPARRLAQPSALLLRIHAHWPLSALVAWSAAWGLLLALRTAGAPLWLAVALATVAGAAVALPAPTLTRRVIVAGGFPVSLLLGMAPAAVPAWTWLLPLALLAGIYPLRAWRDAPWFPTPVGALDEPTRLAPLPPGSAVLDAGCGAGHGLKALRRAYPDALVAGTEWSRPLAWLARLRCGWAQVRRGDLWRQDWAPFVLVYLFQRPESLPRAVTKATEELAPGAWLASLEFPAVELVPQAVGYGDDGRPVWLYRQPFQRAMRAPDMNAILCRGSSSAARDR
jgi:hypothetical protein